MTVNAQGSNYYGQQAMDIQESKENDDPIAKVKRKLPDLSRIAIDQMDQYFPTSEPKKMELLSLYSPDDINSNLSKLSGEHIRYLSKDQLEKLVTAWCSEEQIDALLNPEAIIGFQDCGLGGANGAKVWYKFVSDDGCVTRQVPEIKYKKLKEIRKIQLERLTALSKSQIEGFISLRIKHKAILKIYNGKI